jgi:PAS domain S-box-containing protein
MRAHRRVPRTEAALTFESAIARARNALLRFVFGAGADSRDSRADLLRAATALAAFAVAFAVNASAPNPATGFSLLLYLPAVFIAAFVTGWARGLLALLAAIGIAWWFKSNPLYGVGLFHGGPGLPLFVFSCIFLYGMAVLARAAVRDSWRTEMRLLRLVESATALLFVTDGDGNPLRPNPGWQQLTGMQWPEYRKGGWMEAIHPEDRPHLPAGALPEGEKAYERELRVRDARADDWRWYRLRSVPVVDQRGDIVEWVGTMHDIHDRKLESEKQELVAGEMRHRMKNLITVIDALAKNSRRRAESTSDVEEFLKRFLGRLHALAAAIDLLLATNHQAIDAHAVVRATLVPFDEEKSSRIRIGGPDLQLSEDLGGGLALAVHELATNALKYGALSVTGGTISLTWTVTPRDDGDEVVFEWQERGGPVPEPPTREGFGNRVIKSVTSREKTGSVRIEYKPEGVTCRIAYVKPRAAANAREAD